MDSVEVNDGARLHSKENSHASGDGLKTKDEEEESRKRTNEALLAPLLERLLEWKGRWIESLGSVETWVHRSH